MGDFLKKVKMFETSLKDTYKCEEDKEGTQSQLEFDEENLTEDFTAIMYAMWIFYQKISGDENCDIIGFTHLLNRLAIQKLQEN